MKVNTIDLVTQKLEVNDISKFIEQLQTEWQDEQRRRHQLWKDITDDVKAEFINGQVVYHSPVKRIHARISLRLMWLIESFLRENPNVGELGVEKCMIRLTRNDYEPDLCFWRQEQAQYFTNDQHIFPAPDFIIEILSNSTEKNDRGIKFRDYERHGVQEYWLISPQKQEIEKYILKDNRYELAQKQTNGQITSEVIEGLTLEFAQIF